MYLAFSASSHAAARVSMTVLDGCSGATIFSEVDASLSSSSLLAHAAMFVLPNWAPRTIISLLVFIWSSFSDKSLLRSKWSLREFSRDVEGTALVGVDGLDEFGLRIGVVDRTGVPFLEGSWLAIGVISVPISLMDTDLAVEGGGINVVALCIDIDESCWLRLTANKSTINSLLSALQSTKAASC